MKYYRPCEIKVGARYNQCGKPIANARRVVFVSADLTRVQYDGESYGSGRLFPVITMEEFLSWAEYEVKDNG